MFQQLEKLILYGLLLATTVITLIGYLWLLFTFPKHYSHALHLNNKTENRFRYNCVDLVVKEDNGAHEMCDELEHRLEEPVFQNAIFEGVKTVVGPTLVALFGVILVYVVIAIFLFSHVLFCIFGCCAYNAWAQEGTRPLLHLHRD